MPWKKTGNRELPPTAGLPIRTGDFISKPSLPLPQALEKLLGLQTPLLTCSGTAALVVILQTLRQRTPGKTEVILPAYTCPLVPLAVALVPGLRPILCDTLPESPDFDPAALATLCGPRTLAVIPTHLGGRVADIAATREAVGTHTIAVIEDAAQALGAYSGTKSVGLEGDAAFFSLAAGKGLTSYEGGILTSRDPDLLTALGVTARNILKPNLVWTIRRCLELAGYTVLYNPSRLGMVYGRQLQRNLQKGDEAAAVGDRFSLKDIPLHSLDALRSKVAANALERLPAFLYQGCLRAEKRIAALERLGITVIKDRPGNRGTWPFFMVLLPDAKGRDAALNRLWLRGLGVSKLFVQPLPAYDFLQEYFPGSSGAYPNARDLADRMLTITNTHWMDDAAFGEVMADIGKCV